MDKTEKIKSAIASVCKDEMAHVASLKPDKNLWLIGERGFDANDNGFYLYKYLLSHPEERIHPVYVIGKGGDDYQKVADLGGDIVEPGSSRHYRLLYKSGALISTHTYGFTPNMNIYYHLAKNGLFKPKGANIFLSHGVTDKDISWLYRENYKPDLFTVSCYPEHKMAEEVYGQPKDVIKGNGLCRYDGLYNPPTPKKQIMIMPTWRLWLNDLTGDEFKASEYYQRWSSILNDLEFVSALKEKGYEIVFYLHPEIKKRMHLFEFDGIRVENKNIQDLMIESEILITDFSSVYSDMAYMGRKIIFWQFDKDRYTNEHYKGLIFDFEDFGTVADENSDIKKVINQVIERPKKDNNYFIHYQLFYNNDNNFCKRTVASIKETVGKKGITWTTQRN